MRELQLLRLAPYETCRLVWSSNCTSTDLDSLQLCLQVSIGISGN